MARDMTGLPDLAVEGGRVAPVRTRMPVYVDLLPPCNNACPAGENIQEWLRLVKAGEEEKAWRELVKNNPFPAIHGRVCYHPCEAACNREELDGAVSIHSVERYLGDLAIEKGWTFRRTRTATGRRVLAIGAGPSGLSAAYQLARKGHAVTIFDERAELGGMMRYGIPGFRTPRPVLDAEIRRILDLGVAARMNCRIGTDLTLDELKSQFDAVFLGLGAQSGRPLPVEGSDAPNVVTATAFLKAFNDGRMRHVGKRVVVVGGGDTSIDVATVARRLAAACSLATRPAP